jgi:hypothetical protein
LLLFKKEKIKYIEEPNLSSEYATPGRGNVSSDGIHPSNQGCKCYF